MTTAAPTTATGPAGAPPAVACRGLEKVFGQGDASVQAVAGLDAAFATGEFTAIMGPSGSGKSTLMHLLAGLETPSAGDIAIEGRSIVGMRDRDLTLLRRDRLGFIFQSFNLVPTLTARQNIALPIRLAGGRVDEGELEMLASRLGILDRLEHLPHELSGGQQQRVAVARALITRPAVVFADEPTGALDLRTGRELLGSLQNAARQRQQTIIMVTHDPAAAAYADRVLILVDGRIAHELRDTDYEAIAATMAEVGA
ncbi:ABC transporter ATP-binding protein [Gulosibacter sp. 10]|uniref:ABC transporter ATP-binding protein n=1 Tax=Gulosibacter sp. 10 TaxID=1255570 RepID=UPI00097F4F01|nr:ABC transporter ATP-binding protein [Gulosibacter sp. 10]SJM61660.1 Methionine ABC transporter ATP-binding protein [Gulosibacter sp. 10]